MKRLFVVGFVVLGTAGTAHAQLDRLTRGLEKAQQIRELRISDQDERALGEAVSQRVRTEFGVYQDREVTRYVTLVGTLLARASSRPGLS